MSHRCAKIPIAFLLTVNLLVVSGCGSSGDESTDTASTEGSPAETPAPVGTDSPNGSDEESAAEPSAPALIDIRNARRPIEGLLVGGQPTPEQLAEAAQAGYSTVVNLRPPGENSEWDEATQAADLGLRYVNIPIAGAADLNADNAALLAEIVNDPATGPLMVHCASGNRVGGLFAMKAFHVDGKSAEEAMQIGREAGLTSLAEPVREGLVR